MAQGTLFAKVLCLTVGLVPPPYFFVARKCPVNRIDVLLFGRRHLPFWLLPKISHLPSCLKRHDLVQNPHHGGHEETTLNHQPRQYLQHGGTLEVLRGVLDPHGVRCGHDARIEHRVLQWWPIVWTRM